MASKALDPQAASAAIPPFTTTIAVPLHCQSCIDDVSRALSEVEGIHSLTPSLSTQTLAIHGTAIPSALLSAVHTTGRPAILRGSGAPDSAAVAILETYAGTHALPRQADLSASTEEGQRAELTASTKKGRPQDKNARKDDIAAQRQQATEQHTTTPISTPVRGLVRLIQVSPTHTLLDIGVSNLSEGRWRARLRYAGDVSRGLASMGEVWIARERRSHEQPDQATGELGDVLVGRDGRGAVVLVKEMMVREVVGRGLSLERAGPLRMSMEVEMERGGKAGGKELLNDEEKEKEKEKDKRQDGASAVLGNGEKNEMNDVIMGVVARSAGVWENEKTVCACSGKTVWEEREEQAGRGML